MGLKNTFEKLSSKQSISRNQGLQLAKNTAAEWNVYIAFLSQLSKLLKEWKEFWKSSHQSNQIPGVLAAEVTTAAEDNQRHEEDCVGHVVRPRILTHK